MVRPLSFQLDVRSLKGWRAALRDFPVLGTISRCRRSVRRQLKMRERMFAAAGHREPDLDPLAREVAEVIRSHLGWPNSNFISEDPCALLFCAPPFGMQDVAALVEISERFHISDDELDDLDSLVFGELVQRIRKALDQRGP